MTDVPGHADVSRAMGLRDFLQLVLRNSLGAFLLAALLLTVILFGALRGRAPLIQYEAETAILTLTAAGQLETVWNLPARTVAIPTIVDDAPETDVRALGPGALVLPEGSRVTLIRMAGEPLRLRIDGHANGGAPTVTAAGLNGELDGQLALPKGAVVTVAGATGDPAASCAHRLPPLALRGVGALEVGASLASDTRDSAEELAGQSEAEFLARNTQPLMAGGRVFVRGRTLLGTSFDADELTLQAGDQLRVPAGAGGVAAVFMLQVGGCAPLAVRGFVQSRDVELLRMGSDVSFARVSFWQAVTKDPLLTLLFGLLGAFLATYWSFVNERAEKP